MFSIIIIYNSYLLQRFFLSLQKCFKKYRLVLLLNYCLFSRITACSLPRLFFSGELFNKISQLSSPPQSPEYCLLSLFVAVLVYYFGQNKSKFDSGITGYVRTGRIFRAYIISTYVYLCYRRPFKNSL